MTDYTFRHCTVCNAETEHSRIELAPPVFEGWRCCNASEHGEIASRLWMLPERMDPAEKKRALQRLADSLDEYNTGVDKRTGQPIEFRGMVDTRAVDDPAEPELRTPADVAAYYGEDDDDATTWLVHLTIEVQIEVQTLPSFGEAAALSDARQILASHLYGVPHDVSYEAAERQGADDEA